MYINLNQANPYKYTVYRESEIKGIIIIIITYVKTSGVVE